MIALLETVAQAVLWLAAALVLARAVRGPTLFDRAVAVETLALGAIGWLLLQAGAREARLYLDAALGLALFSFVGAAVVARLAGRGEIEDD